MQSPKFIQFSELDTKIQNQLREAKEARNRSYSPYSKFKVGASLECEDGSFYSGCNVENSSIGLSICAERTAYVKAISEGKTKFKSVAVVAYQEKYITPPCGACRQFMSEFGNVDMYLAKPSLEEVAVLKLNELLPMQFQHNSDYTF